MGHCASSQKRTNPKAYHFECEPAGTEALKGKSLPKLLFHAVLANVKLKKYPYKKATAYFRVREGQNFSLQTKNCNDEDTIMWKIYETFDFQMTEYELRKQFLEVVVLKEDYEQVARIRINLFLITTGPFHQDFALQYPNGKTGRISFDLKISQIIDLKIQSQESEIFLNKKHPGEEFCYSIKTIVPFLSSQNGFTGLSVQSKFSYPAMVLLQNKSEDTKDAQYQLPELSRRKSKRQTTTKQIREGGQLKWTKEGQLPSITTKVIASELHNTYFQILIWKYQSQLQTTMELFVDSYVSFYKLLGTQPRTFKEGQIQYEQRSIKMSEKVQQRGKDYGTGMFRFTIVNPTYFKQYQLCIHTEVGILKTNPIFGIEETKSTDKCNELRDLLSISHSVEQNFILLNKVQTEQLSRGQVKNLREVIENQLSDIYNILEKTSHSPGFLYTYSSERDLLEGQKILVQLGVKIAQYIENDDPIAKDLCWLILISLLKRGEFGLSHMGFNDKQKKQIANNQNDGLLDFKQEVANMYKVFLYKLLDNALNSIDHKGSDYQRTFAEIFSAFAYFRIPQFRKEILRLITKESDPQIQQWRGVDFNLQDDIGESRFKEIGNTFSEMFDWEHNFYKYLRANHHIESNHITLKEILMQQNWKDRFIKRGLAFFYFLKYWVTYVDSSLPHSPDIQWLYFPGYNRLLRGFFVELKNRPILQYPDALIEAALKLLMNQKLLNPMMKIMINKVNVYDGTAVIRFIDYLNLMLQTVGSRQKRRLPFSFNYNIFFKALTIIFDTDFSIAVTSALTMIYNKFDMFHLQFRRSLSMYFLGSAFNKFFLHWSYNVRFIFYHLITYKIYKDALQDDKNCTFQHSSDIQNENILTRYESLIKILAVEFKNYKQSKKQHLHPYLDRNLFKKMKIRMLSRLDQQEEIPIFRSPSKKETTGNKSVEEIRDNRSEFSYKTDKQTSERCNSEIWTERKLRFQPKKNEHNNKKEQIKRMSRSNQFSYEHNYIGKKSSLFYEIIPTSQFQIKDIEPSMLKLIEMCLPEFKKIEKEFFEGLEKGHCEAPVIKPEISIDKREIRPKQFDEW